MKKLTLLISLLPFVAYSQDKVKGINGIEYSKGEKIVLSDHGAADNNDFMFIRKASGKFDRAFRPIEAEYLYLSDKKFSGQAFEIVKIDKSDNGSVLTVKSEKDYYLLLDSAIKYSELENSNQIKRLRYGEILFPMEDGKVSYTGVIEVPNVSKNELYLRAKEWFARTFKSAQNVIQLDDKESGKIIGKGLTKQYYQLMMQPINLLVNYTVSISCKDGKYKYVIDNIYGETGTLEYKMTLEEYLLWVEKGKSGSNNVKKKILPKINESIIDLEKTIIDNMVKKAKGDDF